jgi:hypothetical protein
MDIAEVGITTRQLAKCEWNSGLASKNGNNNGIGCSPLNLKNTI